MSLSARWRSLARSCPYCAYFIVGSAVSGTAVLVRELMQWALGSDSPVLYATTVALVNVLGMVTAFFAHQRFTFAAHELEGGARGSLWKFVAIAMLGTVVTAATAVILRYGLRMDAWLGRMAPPVAFAVALVLASLLNYYLNSIWNFGTGTSKSSGKGAGK